MTERVRILVIDDDQIDRRAIRHAIEESGLAAEIDEVADVAEVADVDKALAKVGSATYDCILLDHDLPRRSGIEFTRELRAAGNLTPIVLVTGQQDEALLQAAASAGVTDFFPKGDLSPYRLGLRIRFAIRIGRAEAQLARSLAQATLAARTRDDILAVVSHDLRGPLHAISLACEALREEVAPGAMRYIGAIERASHRAERLISDLLEASAIETGGLTLARRTIDAAAIVRQAAADHELAVKEAGGKITALVPPEPTLVSADRDRVLQVLGNLIGNALKHARGTPIELQLSRSDKEAIIAVRDHGPGIPAAELPHVFDRYWQGRTKKAGAGLGLSIAKGIVDAHGGRIDVASRPGEGTELSFTLPLAP
jgi:two-component system sensor histidine kinase/response regulator